MSGKNWLRRHRDKFTEEFNESEQIAIAIARREKKKRESNSGPLIALSFSKISRPAGTPSCHEATKEEPLTA